MQQEVVRLQAELKLLRYNERAARMSYDQQRSARRAAEAEHAAAEISLRDLRAREERAARLFSPRSKTYPLAALLQELPAAVQDWDIRDLHLRTRRNRVWLAEGQSTPTALRDLSIAWRAGTLHELPLIYPDSRVRERGYTLMHRGYDLHEDDDMPGPIIRMVPIDMLVGERDAAGAPQRFRFEARDRLPLGVALRAFPPNSRVPAMALLGGISTRAKRYVVRREPGPGKGARVEREGPSSALTVQDLRDVGSDPERGLWLSCPGERWSSHISLENPTDPRLSSDELLRLPTTPQLQD